MRSPESNTHSALADAVGANIEGRRIGSVFIDRCRSECLDRDELSRTLRRLIATESVDVFRGFARAVQKRLESR